MATTPPKVRWKLWARSLHRDVGFFFIGLTVIYALSGLAVNHIDDWDPNFTHIEERRALPPELTRSESGQLSESSEDIARTLALRWSLSTISLRLTTASKFLRTNGRSNLNATTTMLN